MKKISLIIVVVSIILLSGCNSNPIWQGYYYAHGQQENETYGPVFTNYEACKGWALQQIKNDDDVVNCSKNCHESLEDGTSVCEEVVRNRALLPGSVIFDTYKE